MGQVCNRKALQVSEYAFEVDPEVYWEQASVNERDEWDAFVRHVDEDERDRMTRDAGEKA